MRPSFYLSGRLMVNVINIGATECFADSKVQNTKEMRDQKKTKYTARQLLAGTKELPAIFINEVGISADESNALLLGDLKTTVEQLRQKLEKSPSEQLVDELEDSVAFRCGLLIKILRTLGELYSKDMMSKIFLTKKYDFLDNKTLKSYLMGCSETQLIEAWTKLESLKQTGYL